MRLLNDHDTGEDLKLQSVGTKSALVLACSLHTADRPVRADGLVDTGCSGEAFINDSLVHKLCLPMYRLRHRRRLTLADGGDSEGGYVTHMTYVTMSIGSHIETLVFYITKLHIDVILGYPWLKKHDPHISFSTDTIYFHSPHCLRHCLPQNLPLRVQGQRLQDSSSGPKPISPTTQSTHTNYQTPSVEDCPEDEGYYSQDNLDQPELIYTTDTVVDCVTSGLSPPAMILPQETGLLHLTDEEAPRRLHPHPQMALFRAGARRHIRRHVSRQTSRQGLEISSFSDSNDTEPLRIRMLNAGSMSTFCRQNGATAQWTTMNSILKNTPKTYYIDSQGKSHHTPKDRIFHCPPPLIPHDIPNHVCRGILSDTIDLSEAKSQTHPNLHEFLENHYAQIHLSRITEDDIEKFLEKQRKKPYTLDELKAKVPRQYHDLVDVFLKSKADKLPPHRACDTKIHLKEGTQPPYNKTRPFTAHEQTVIKAYCDELLEKGFIRRSTSPASSPVLLAKKPGGGVRICVDYRGLNEITIRNRFPLPLVHDTLDQLKKAKVFTKLDVIAAFNKLRVAEGDEWKTAFITRYGLYEYCVTPFGLTNAPAYFQDFINQTLHDILDKYCSAYLDDVIIFSQSQEEHIRHVREVLQRLRAAGLQIDIDKCEFSVTETKYLGLIISDKGIRMDPDKVQAIINWASPDSCTRGKIKELQRFLGFANFYRRFIKGYSKIAQPLTGLTRKDAPWVWTEACQRAFDQLRNAFRTAPVLAYFDPTSETVVETDASDWASGGVLSQRGDDGFWHPVAFFSSKHTAQECNYEIYDKELLAIVKALEEWRPELEGLERFDILTDHQNLQYFMTTKLLNQRQARWAEFLSRFNFTIKYQSGKKADRPDALSRLPGTRPESKSDLTDERINHRYQTVLPESKRDPDFVLTASSLSLRGLGDEPVDELIDRVYATSGTVAEMIQIITAKKKKKWPKSLRSELRHIPLGECTVLRERIYCKGRLFLPQSEEVALQLIYRSHNTTAAGHPGKSKTAELVRRSYIWPRMHQDIARYVRNCHQCTRSKFSRSAPQGLLQSLEVPFRAWTDISVDYVTGLPPCKRGGRTYRHVLVVVDRLTKMRHFVATETLETEELVDAFVSRIWSLHGTPQTIVSDRGSQFVSCFWRQLNKRLRTKLTPSSAHHPETDGQTENANAGMEAYLRNYVSYLQDDWADWLPLAEFSINNAVNESTNLSPFFANYGYHPLLGVEPSQGPVPPMSSEQKKEYLQGQTIADRFDKITSHLRTSMANAQEKQAFYANEKRVEAPDYKVGDWVFINRKNLKTDRPSLKLDTKREGPFQIVKTYKSTCVLDLRSKQSYSTVPSQLSNQGSPGPHSWPGGAEPAAHRRRHPYPGRGR